MLAMPAMPASHCYLIMRYTLADRPHRVRIWRYTDYAFFASLARDAGKARRWRIAE